MTFCPFNNSTVLKSLFQMSSNCITFKCLNEFIWIMVRWDFKWTWPEKPIDPPLVVFQVKWKSVWFEINVTKLQTRISIRQRQRWRRSPASRCWWPCGQATAGEPSHLQWGSCRWAASAPHHPVRRYWDCMRNNGGSGSAQICKPAADAYFIKCAAMHRSRVWRLSSGSDKHHTLLCDVYHYHYYLISLLSNIIILFINIFIIHLPCCGVHRMSVSSSFVYFFLPQSAEFSWDTLASLQQQGFTVEPSKGTVEAGLKRTIRVTWSPQSGYKVRRRWRLWLFLDWKGVCYWREGIEKSIREIPITLDLMTKCGLNNLRRCRIGQFPKIL